MFEGKHAEMGGLPRQWHVMKYHNCLKEEPEAIQAHGEGQELSILTSVHPSDGHHERLLL